MIKLIKYEKIRNRKNMFKVFFDNDKTTIFSADTIVKFNLKPEIELEDEVYKEITSYDMSNRAVSDALSLAAKRSYSAKTLYEKLLQKGYDNNAANNAVNRLKELNYINDEKFATVFAQYLVNRGKGEFAIKTELDKRGISKELISKALKTIKSNEEPYEQIIKMIISKYKNFDGKDKNEVRKVASFFLRRGFASEDIAKAFREYKNISIEI